MSRCPAGPAMGLPATLDPVMDPTPAQPKPVSGPLARVSIVTVVLNDPEGLEATLGSVAAQDHPGVEQIVIDGGSRPPTLDVIAGHRGRIAQFVSEPDRGLYDAMNKGLRLATGTWVQFLNAGDTFRSPTALSSFLAQADPTADALYGDHLARYPGWDRPMRAGTLAVIDHRGFCCHQALLVRTALAHELGGFREDRWPAADYDFMCRLALRRPSAQHIPQELVTYQCGGLSERNALRSRWIEWAISREHFGGSLRRDLNFCVFILAAGVHRLLGICKLDSFSTTLRKLIHRFGAAR